MATVVPRTEVRNYQMYIDGRWTDASGGETYAVVDPASEEVIAHVPKASVEDAERAVRAAREAFDNGPWPKMKAVERAEVLNRAAALIRERAEDLARLESMQMGKLLEEARVDMQDAAHTFELYAGMVQDQHGETLEVPGETMSLVVREPIGVTVGITPWNYPMLMAAWKAGPVARRRQRDDPQAGHGEPAHQPRARQDPRGGRAAQGRVPGRHRARRRDRRLPRRRTRTSTWWPSPARWRSASTSCAGAPRT